ncbi:MAG TPA: hypothetical protein VIY48_09795 [Candidatus Paceibacterota bacterium]
MEELIGKSIKKIEISEELLRFTTTDDMQYSYLAVGDCCSSSYFYDFYGVKNLLAGNPITAIEEVDLGEEETSDDSLLQLYGVRLITTAIIPKYPNIPPVEVSAIFSFRNESNGYYGGYLEKIEDASLYNETNLVELTDDIQEVLTTVLLP